MQISAVQFFQCVFHISGRSKVHDTHVSFTFVGVSIRDLTGLTHEVFQVLRKRNGTGLVMLAISDGSGSGGPVQSAVRPVCGERGRDQRAAARRGQRDKFTSTSYKLGPEVRGTAETDRSLKQCSQSGRSPLRASRQNVYHIIRLSSHCSAIAPIGHARPGPRNSPHQPALTSGRSRLPVEQI